MQRLALTIARTAGAVSRRAGRGGGTSLPGLVLLRLRPRAVEELAAGLADLCALARPHLVDPHLTLRAAVHYGHDLASWPRQYLPAKPRPRP